MPSNISIEDCLPERDITPIRAILNHVIASSTALYDYEPRSIAEVTAWAKHKIQNGLPLRGAFDASGVMLGFATYGPFRPQPAYKYTVEHSIYVNEQHRGLGVGTQLLDDLIKRATDNQRHVLIGCIDTENRESISLHQKFGFEHCGTIKQAGFKFGRWLDAAFYQKTLQTPDKPVDG